MAATHGIRGVPDVADAAFVGRARELAAFTSAFGQMLAGRRQILTIAGEPGIGKTRLAEAFARAAEDRGALVLWGRCYEEPGAPPYWPWVQILREFVEALSPSELGIVAGNDGIRIATLVPELGIALGASDAASPVSPETSQDRFRMLDAIAGFLRRAAAQVPLVLLIDNAHWGDKASLALLEFLSQELVRSRVVIVCTYRDTELSRNSPLPATLGVLGGSDGIVRLKLQGLERSAIALLADGLLGRHLSPTVIAAIDEQTDGNPLFVIELLRVLIEESWDAGVEPLSLRVPDGVREAIGRRLSRLPARVNDLLRIAAVIGREFEADVLGHVADADVDEIVDVLHPAEVAGFVEVADSSRQAYRYTHALIRETLYDELSTPERLRLHGRVGDAMVALCPEASRGHLSAIAHHYFESAALGHADVATDYAERAGHEAMRLDAYDEAATHYGNVIRLLRQTGLGGPARLRQAIYWQARALTGTAQGAEAVALIAPALEDPELGQDVPWLVDIMTQWIILTSFNMQAERLPLLRRIGERLPAGDSPARAKALACEALAERTLGVGGRVRQLIDDALAMARRVGDPDALSHCLRSSLLALATDPAEIDLRLRLGDEYIASAPPGDTCERLAEALYHQGCNLVEAGRIDAVDRVLEHLGSLNASRHGFQAYRLRALHVVLALVRGEYLGLADKIEALRELGQKSRGDDADGVYGVQMFMLNRDLGRLHALAPLIERFAASRVHRAWTPGLMLALTEIGNLDAAARELDKLAAGGFGAIPLDAMRIPTLVYCAETCAAVGDVERARALYDLLAPYAATFASHHLTVCFGSTERYLGMLSATIGEADLARQHFENAIRANAAAHAWPWLARTYHQYALALRRTEAASDRNRAEQLLREAEQLAGGLGMEGLVAEIGTLLRGRRTPETYPDELTAREVDVLKLIAIGRSNKDIAMVLSISLNTVATHVRNILNKTDCANRTEAAAYANRSGLLAAD